MGPKRQKLLLMKQRRARKVFLKNRKARLLFVMSSAHSSNSGPSAESMGMSADEHAAHLGISQTKSEKLAELKDMRNKVISVIPIAIFSIFVMGWEIFARFNAVSEMSLFWKEFFHHFLPVLAILRVVCGRQTISFGRISFFCVTAKRIWILS